MNPHRALLVAALLCWGIAQPNHGHAAKDPASSGLPLQSLIESAREQLGQGDSTSAYQALNDAVALYAGSVEFDYLLGLAALDAAHPGAAILAFERVLTLRPDHLQARAELGRAYLLAGERDNARRAFRDVAARDIPAQARKLIGQYLDAITQLDAAHKTVVSGQLNLEIGVDDNANFGSASNTWTLGDGTPVTPLPVSLPKKSTLIGIDGGLSISGPIDGQWRWTAGLRGAVRRYPSATTLDQEQADISVGLRRGRDCQQYAVLAQHQNLRLDGVAFRNATGVLGQWQCDVNRRWHVGANIQSFSLSFPGQPVRDGRRNALGINLAHALGASADTTVSASVQFGSESSDPSFPNLAHRFTSLRAALNMPIAANWRGEVGLLLESRRFDGIEPLFSTIRRDNQTEFRVSAQRWLGRAWSIQPQLIWTRNSSTLAPNDFKRTQALVRMSYRF